MDGCARLVLRSAGTGVIHSAFTASTLKSPRWARATAKLCLHGFPEHAYSCRHQMPLLAHLGYRVWAPNLRGYGATDSPREVAAYRTNTLGDEQYVSDLTFRVLPGVSHWIQQEAPKEVNAMLEAWLTGKRVPDTASSPPFPIYPPRAVTLPWAHGKTSNGCSGM